MITLFQFEISPFCDKVRRVLHFKGLAYNVHGVSLQRAVSEVSKVSPAAKLPALVHDGTTVYDSTDIAYYLEENFPKPSLIPEDPRQRGLMHVIEDWADESLFFYEIYLRFGIGHNARHWVPLLCASDTEMVKKAAGFIIPRHMKGILAKQGLGRKPKDQILADVERHCQSLNDMLLDSVWLVGDKISLADIAVISQLDCILGTDEGKKAVADKPKLADWITRVKEATDKAAAPKADLHAAG